MGFLKKIKNKKIREDKMQNTKSKKKHDREQKKKLYSLKNLKKEMSCYEDECLYRTGILFLKAVYENLKLSPEDMVQFSKDTKFISSCLHDECEGLGIQDFAQHLKEETGYHVQFHEESLKSGNTSSEDDLSSKSDEQILNEISDSDIDEYRKSWKRRISVVVFDDLLVITMWILYDKHGESNEILDNVYKSALKMFNENQVLEMQDLVDEMYREIQE